jgi:carboxyl-terminal processing protease
LQDHKRAIILGTKSFGKGSVQTIQELRNGSAVKLTTARYFTPLGRSIQATGIEPDIKLSTVKLSADDEKASASYSEADLDGSLSNPNGDSNAEQDKKEDSEALAKSDFQLYEALNLLKGLNILSGLNGS